MGKLDAFANHVEQADTENQDDLAKEYFRLSMQYLELMEKWKCRNRKVRK